MKTTLEIYRHLCQCQQSREDSTRVNREFISELVSLKHNNYNNKIIIK